MSEKIDQNINKIEVLCFKKGLEVRLRAKYSDLAEAYDNYQRTLKKYMQDELDDLEKEQKAKLDAANESVW